jgi:hypothetical protein
VDWLFPTAEHNPRAPTLRVAIKHAPDQTASLSVGGRPVGPLAFDGVQVSADRRVAVSVWRGVPLAEGVNRLSARCPAGRGLRSASTVWSATPTRPTGQRWRSPSPR